MSSTVTATVTYAAITKDEDGWEHRVWNVKLKYNGRTMDTRYRTGMALGQPTVEDVMQSLCDDAQGVEFDSFEDWAGEYGYDTDSRKAERIYTAVVEQTERLRVLLGADFASVCAASRYDD